MLDGRCSWDQQDIGRVLEKPGKRNLHWCGLKRRCGCVKRGRLQWSEASEREKRNIRYPLRGQVIDESIVVPLGHVVEILHADNLRHGLRFGQLLGRNVAQADVTDQPLTLELDERGQRLFDRSFRRFREPSNAEIHDVKSVQAKIPKIVVNAVNEFLQ